MSIGDSWWQIQRRGLSESVRLSPVLSTASQPRYHPDMTHQYDAWNDQSCLTVEIERTCA